MKRLPGVLLALLLGIAVVGAALPLSWATDTAPDAANLGPCALHWLGTDRHGRDLATRLFVAVSNGVGPGVGACLVATGVGVPVGALAGWLGGRTEDALRFVVGAIAAIPRYVGVLLMLAILRDSLTLLAVAAGLAWAPPVAEAVRTRVARLRDAEYVLASTLHGVPGWRILWVHLVWGASRVAVARELLSLIGGFIVLEASLGYIGGFGIREPVPSWGNLLAMQWNDGPWTDPRFWVPAITLVATIAVLHGAAASLRDPIDA